MKKIAQYLPFILWSIFTVSLTVLLFVLLPVLLLREKFNDSRNHSVRSPKMKLNQTYVKAISLSNSVG